jgi:esterase/lipase
MTGPSAPWSTGQFYFEVKMNKNLFLIHGAWCTKNSYNYIIKKILDDHFVGNIHCFEYDCNIENLSSITKRAKKQLEEISKNGLKTVVVGHSMGGLIALRLSQKKEVYKTITLASPLSGLKFNRIIHAVLLYHAPALKDLIPDSKFLKCVHEQSYSKNPIEIYITTNGFNPMIFEPSDGVIPLESQTKWYPENSKVVEIQSNHSEILQSTKVIMAIENALK